MAVYDASGNVVSLTGVHAVAERRVKSEIHANLFNRIPVLTAFASKAGGDGKFGRVGSLGILGGKKFDRVQMENEAGTEVHVRMDTAKSGGSKWMAERDTVPSMGNAAQNDNYRTAVFRPSLFSTPYKVWKNDIRRAKGKYAIGNLVQEAIDKAMEEHLEELNDKIWRGSPSDQSSNLWTEPLGIVQALDTDNVYGNVNRSTYSTWAGKRVTSSKTISLNLIDDANVIQGIMNRGPGVDLVFCGAANYNALKQEALTRGQTVTVSNMPNMAEVGVRSECIQYGKTMIVYDPFLTGNWSTIDADITDATKVVAMFTMEDWVFTTNPSANFRVTPAEDFSKQQGGDDAIGGLIETMPMLRCNKPHRSIVYTNVNLPS